MAIEPTAFVGIPSEICFQEGFCASAFFVRQRPPPAAPRYSVHSCGLHFGSTASAVTRPDHFVGLMKDWVPSRSTSSVSGPMKSHFELSFAPRAVTALFAARAPWIWSMPTSSPGKARSEYASASAPPPASSARSRSSTAACARRAVAAFADADCEPEPRASSSSETAASAPVTRNTAVARQTNLVIMRPLPSKNRDSDIAQTAGSESTAAVISHHPLLGAIADDVTGATDLCSTLRREGMRAVQTFGVVRELELDGADAVVVSLKSRTAPADDAVRDSLAALAWLEELAVRQVFFKICSTFDSTPAGNIGPVGDALLDALGTELTVVCPVYPANGRTLYQGHLFVGARLLSESSLARHPLTPMTDADIVRVLARQTRRPVRLIPHGTVAEGAGAIERALADLRAAGVAYAVVDALTDGDLRAIGAASAGLRLVIGGSGVALGLRENFRRAGALGARPAAALEAPTGPAVVLAGSCSAATQEQVRRMAGRYPALKLPVDGTADVAAAGEQAAAHLARGPVLLYTTAPPDEVAEVQARVGAERAQREAESVMGELARRAVAAGATRIVVAGGETSGAVLGALGIRALETGAEIAPGVPWMRSIDEPQLALALKSGNFGGPDFFLDALEGAR